MEKIKTFLSSVPRWQLFLIPGILILLISSIFFGASLLRKEAVIKLGSTAGLTVTADKQDSLGIFSDSHFTLKSDQDLSVKAIKDNLKTDPEVKVEIVEVSPRQYQIVPKEPLKNNEIIKIKLSTGEREYSWAFQTKNDFRVIKTLPADKTTSVPVNSGIEITFSHDNYNDINNYFSISPKVDGRFERHQRTTSFVPSKLEPSTLYTVTLKKGVKLSGSSDVLTEDKVFRFETASDNATANVQNRLNFVKPAYEFSTKDTPAIDLNANNLNELTSLNVSVYKYPSLNKFSEDYQNKLSIPRWAINFYDRFVLSTAGLSKTIEFTAPVQKANYSGYFLFPQTLSKGYYLVEAVNGAQKTQALVQVTDLSAYFTVSGSQTLAWVNRVDTGSPVPQASINVLGQTYTTDKDGVAAFTSPASLVDDANKLITIKDTQDSLLIPAADRNFYFPYGSYESDARNSDKYWSYLYLDRPIYQPGDTVRFWGLLRDRDDLNKTQKLTISLSRSDYLDYNFNEVSVYEKEYTTTNIGTFIGDMALPRLNPGWYTISIKVNDKVVVSSGLSVETYTKPAYQLTLDSAKNAVIAGEPIDLSGKAAFFEGTPVGNLQLKVFGHNESQVTTNDQGNFSLSVATVSNPEGEYYQPQYRNFSVSPVLSEEGDINAGATVAVFNSSIYLGTKTENKNSQAKVTISLNQVDLSKFQPYQYTGDLSFVGAPVGNHQIQGTLYENSWQKNQVGTYYDFINKTTSPKYEYVQIKNNLGQFTLDTDAQGKAVYQFPTQNDKFYEIKLSSLDSDNRLANQSVFIYGTDLSYTDNRLLLTEDKTDQPGQYLIDEPVSLTPIQNGSAITSGKMLYLFAQRGIRSYNLTGTQKFTFNFKEAFVPDVYVQAVRFTGSTYQLSESKQLRFDTSSKKISLDFKLDKPFYQPGDKAHLTVSAKDTKGSPLSSEVNLNLVDEAIFQMSPVTTDPLSQIYKNVGSDIVSYYMSHQYPIEQNAAEGGGCFLSGTKVLMSDNSVKNIETVKPGDYVKTRTSANDPLMVSAKVLQVQKHTVGEYLMINHHLRVTPEHNLYVNGRWITAGEIRVGDSYLDVNNQYQNIDSIERYYGVYTVYNFTVEKYHTYFADGVFVHNEKGRDLFVDTAYFGSVQTGANGEASVDITLPDNLTSWRITGQSITSDLKSGAKTEKLVVKLPFFVDLVLGKDYLLADKPVLTLRGFGDQLHTGDAVNYHVSIPTLNYEKDLAGQAYQPVGLALPQLSVGQHSVVVTAQSGALKDKITRSFNVVQSRVQMRKSSFQDLSTDTKITGATSGITEVVFSDRSTGRFLSLLNRLSYSSGDRLDQKLSRVVAEELIQKYFDNTTAPEAFNPSIYLMTDGGFALLPYGSSDLKLSAQVACIGGNRIDKSGLTNYLYNSFTAAKDTVSASQALSGLACLQQPVLLLVDKFYSLPDLDPESKIYLSLASASLGDTEKSYSVAKQVLEDFGETQDNLTFVKVGKTKDEFMENSLNLAAALAMDNRPESDSLFNYVSLNSSQDILLSANTLFYVSQRISKLTPSSASFSYVVDGKKTTKDLKAGGSVKMILSSDQLQAIKFEDISGSIGVTSSYLSSDTSGQSSKDLTLNRNYSVSGKSTTEFVSTDTIKVTLNYSIKQITQDGCYQIDDFLPSGFRAVTRLYNSGLDTKDINYPYAIDGQKVSFCANKNDQKPITYYARIISPGSFMAESALMQSMISPSIFTLSNSSQVNIK